MTEQNSLPDYHVEIIPVERRLGQRRNTAVHENTLPHGERRKSARRSSEERRGAGPAPASGLLHAPPPPDKRDYTPPASGHEGTTPGASGRIARDSRNTTLWIWLGTAVLGFIPGLVFFLSEKDDAYIRSQSREALNWAITALAGYLGCLILSFVAIGVLLLPAVGLCHLAFCIMGAVAASNGRSFQVPFALRPIK